jgi:hypothetical protein
VAEECSQPEDGEWLMKEDCRPHRPAVKTAAVGCCVGPPVPSGEIRADIEAVCIRGLPGEELGRCRHLCHLVPMGGGELLFFSFWQNDVFSMLQENVCRLIFPGPAVSCFGYFWSVLVPCMSKRTEKWVGIGLYVYNMPGLTDYRFVLHVKSEYWLSSLKVVMSTNLSGGAIGISLGHHSLVGSAHVC